MNTTDMEIITTIQTALVQHEKAEDLETEAFPIRPVNFLIPATLDDIEDENWPPTRFRNRNYKLELMDDLWDGDFSRFVKNKRSTRVSFNHFRKITTFTVDMLMSSRATLNVEDLMRGGDLVDALCRTITDQMKYGGSTVLGFVYGSGDEEDEAEDVLELLVVEPQYFYPLLEGGFIVAIPFISEKATGDEYDKARVIVAQPDEDNGLLKFRDSIYTRSGSSSDRTGGGLSEEDGSEVRTGAASAKVILRSPITSYGWGTPIFNDIAPLVLEQSIRLSSFSHVLNANEKPTLAFKTGDGESNLLTVDQDVRLRDVDQRETYRKYAQEVVTTYMREIMRQDVATNILWGDAKYIEFTGQLSASQFFIQHLHQLISMSTGIPQVLYETGTPTSGVALDEMLIGLYLSTLAIFNRTKRGMEELLNDLVGVDDGNVQLEWDHYIDVKKKEASANMARSLDRDTPPTLGQRHTTRPARQGMVNIW